MTIILSFFPDPQFNGRIHKYDDRAHIKHTITRTIVSDRSIPVKPVKSHMRLMHAMIRRLNVQAVR